MDLHRFLFPPVEGVFYALELVHPNGKRRRVWFTDGADIHALCKHEDAAGWHCYWRIGRYQDKSDCKLTNVESVGLVAFDIDIRPDKPGAYSSQAELGRDLIGFLRAYGLPEPLIVLTGGGVHVYWVLEEALPRQEWQVLARAMVSAANDSGLRVDAGPSCNATGLLRVVETNNPKYDRQVSAINADRIAPVPASVLLEAVKDHIRKDVAHGPLVTARLPLRVTGPASVLVYPTDDVGLHFDDMLRGCEQMRLGPHGAEPAWVAGLSVIRLFPNWEDLARKWSESAPDRFDEQVFEKKVFYLGARGFTPTRCSTFDLINPGVCIRCPNFGRVTSPIQLARRNTNATVNGASHQVDGAAEPGSTLPPEALEQVAGWFKPSSSEFRRDLSGLILQESPRGYYSTPEGIPCKKVYEVDKATGKREHVGNLTLFEGPVKLVARVDTSAAGTREDAVVIDFYYHGDLIRVVPPVSLLAAHTDNSAFYRYLANYSILVPIPNIAKEFATWLRVAVDECYNKLPKLYNSESMGWTRSGFVVGDSEARSDGSEVPAWLIGSAHSRARRYVPIGTLADWLKVPAIYKRQGRMEMMFGFLQSFASPLMFMAGEQGMVVHLCSSTSGTGKSTLLRAINSVWGDGHRLLMTARDTENSTAKLFAISQNLPATIDELTNMDPRAVSNLVFAATQGMQKNRLTQNAEIRDSGTWALIAITSGNESLRGKLSLNGRSDSQAENMRILEIEVNPMDEFDPYEAVLLDNAIRANGGVAGRVYARWLACNRALLEKKVMEAKSEWTKVTSAGAAERFWMACFAATEVAADLAYRAGLHDFDWPAIKQWILDDLLPSQRRQVNVSRGEHLVNEFADFLLAEIQPYTLITRCAYLGYGNFADGGSSVNYALSEPLKILARLEKDTGTLYISCAAASDYARKHGIPKSKVAECLQNVDGFEYHGVFDINLGGGVLKGSASGRVRCYKLTSSYK